MNEKDQAIAASIDHLAEEIMHLGNGTYRGTEGKGAIEQMADIIAASNDNVARSIDTLAGAVSEMAEAIQTLASVVSETRK